MVTAAPTILQDQLGRSSASIDDGFSVNLIFGDLLQSKVSHIFLFCSRSIPLDGAVQAFEVVDGVAIAAPITPTHLPAGMPPLLIVENGAARLVAPTNASPLTAPALFGVDGLAFIDTAGNLVIERGGETVTLNI